MDKTTEIEEKKKCTDCEYFEGESYHDKMYCRDCRQMDRFKKKLQPKPPNRDKKECNTCKSELPEGRCSHPQGCEADYELWEAKEPKEKKG